MATVLAMKQERPLKSNEFCSGQTEQVCYGREASLSTTAVLVFRLISVASRRVGLRIVNMGELIRQ